MYAYTHIYLFKIVWNFPQSLLWLTLLPVGHWHASDKCSCIFLHCIRINSHSELCLTCVSGCYISSLLWNFIPVTFCSPVILPFACFFYSACLWEVKKKSDLRIWMGRTGRNKEFTFTEKSCMLFVDLGAGIQNCRSEAVIRPAWKKFGYRDRSLRSNFYLANFILSLQIFVS